MPKPGPRHLPSDGGRPLHVAAEHQRRSRQYPDDRGHAQTVWTPFAFAPPDIQRKRYHKRSFVIQGSGNVVLLAAHGVEMQGVKQLGNGGTANAYDIATV